MRKQVVRYVISGGTAVAINYAVLYALTELLMMWYVLSVAIAFVFSFFTSFALQKLWTFDDKDFSKIHQQTIRIIGVTAIGMGINVIGVYILVSGFGMWYMLAQTIMLGILAIGNFFAYKHIVFV